MANAQYQSSHTTSHTCVIKSTKEIYLQHNPHSFHHHQVFECDEEERKDERICTSREDHGGHRKAEQITKSTDEVRTWKIIEKDLEISETKMLAITK